MTKTLIAKALKDPEALKRELWGWYIYDFANSAFGNSAGGMFIPLLVEGLGTEYAWSQQGSTRPKPCSELEGENRRLTDCVRCVEGYGDRLITIDPITGAERHVDTEILRLPGGIQPTSFFFTMLCISVVFQVVVFITVASLGDYGNYRRRGLVVSSTIGALATCCYIFVPISASLYWLGGLLVIIANVSLGVSLVFYNSYLPLMVKDSTMVREAEAAAASGMVGEDEVRAAQEKVSSEYSSNGVMWGYIGGSACLALSLLVVVALTLGGVSSRWTLGIGCMLSGVWWLVFSVYAFARLPERPGPPLPQGSNLLSIGWIRTYRLLAHVAKNQPQTGWFLVLFFFFSDGYTTIATVSVLFASRELCMGILPLAGMSLLVPVFAAVGGYACYKFQMYSKWSTKGILVLNLFLLAWLPLWGCVGFFSSSIGLRTQPEMLLLAVWFGLFLGSASAYGRALFSELIPEGHEADMFALFEITDKGSSWLGPLVASVILQMTGKIRPVLIYLLCAMVLPALLLHHLDLSEVIKSARTRTGTDGDKGEGEGIELLIKQGGGAD
uniref:Autophagy-related protein n=1 Tax=Mantoniella antarctica TaxID=81844 RepID=A0A7S0XG84_9CHLO|mmetsp:Transcript_4469/g.10967  ORF Transcript_4469/g.10967 Transcript_4469/m.10967 type:complete len:555 (+) Transcript_4469:166-1830(+)